MTLQELLDYYSNQLIIQYGELPKAKRTIQCLVNQSVCDGLILDLKNAFNLDEAFGAQLTILGKIVGVPRSIYGLDLTHEFFNFTRYTGVPSSNGFNRWSTPEDTKLISRWLTTFSYTTTDFELLSLIKLKILYNISNNSLKNIKEYLVYNFGNSIDVVDNLDSTITYNIKSPYYNVGIICEFLGNILPKPMGIGMTVAYI